MKPDLTHQHVARVLMQDHAHRYTPKELSFIRQMSTVEYMTDKQEAWLAKLDERRAEAVK